MTEGRIFEAILKLGILVFSLSLHEFGHAYAAYRLGDPTAKMLGRLTLDPRAHADLIGTILMPLLMILNPGLRLFGWAKPVPVTPENFQNPKRDGALVALAGPAANLLLCVFSLAALSILDLTGFLGLSEDTLPIVLQFFRTFFWLNFVLAVFNLIPLYPLDGNWILKYFLPGKLSYSFARLDRFSGMILLVVFFTGGFNLLFSPLANGLFDVMHLAGMGRLSRMIF
ncbi:MAG TPA: site-2 protease family protein [bacterium]|nr:site-2 protease family protein [bacterium]